MTHASDVTADVMSVFMDTDAYAVQVDYVVTSAQPGGTNAAAKSINVVPLHLPDLSADTARPHQRRSFFIPTDATDGIPTPTRGDTITYDGNTWVIFDVLQEELGVIQVFARIGQVEA